MSELCSIILAAGRGTRMKSDLPKVLHQVAGRPMIEYVIDITKALGSLTTYVVVGHGADQVKHLLGLSLSYVLQENQLGTADAVKRVLPHLKSLNGDVLILCGDTPLLEQSIVADLVAQHRKTEAAVTVLTARLKDPQGYGRIIRNAKGDFIAIREQKNASPQEQAINEINVGVYCVKAQSLSDAVNAIQPNPLTKEFYLTDAIEWLLAKKMTVDTLITEDETTAFGVNTRVHLAAAESIMRQRIMTAHMLNGVSVIDPQNTYIEHGVSIGQDTTIFPGSYLHGGVQVGAKCKIGPFARLRPGTTVEDGAEIGNFTEVSRSTIGRGVMMKHFSFVGDAVVGSESNIGAGTVTANYDGVHKNKTVIGKKAFIGSDSILVAPVTVGDESVVGAGAVVKQGTHIPPGKKAVGVPARII